MEKKMQAPLININGTSADDLLTQIINAMVALRKAQQAVTDAAPHGRDYQTAKDGTAFRLATAEHRSRLLRLAEIAKELEDVGHQINEQRAKLKSGSDNIPVEGSAPTVHQLVAAPLVHEPSERGEKVHNDPFGRGITDWADDG